VLRHDGADQVVTRSIMDTSGRSASVTRHINLDRTKPHLEVDGVIDGHTYNHKPTLVCNASDALSGIASCHIRKRHHTHADGTTTFHFVGVAKDVAGNKTKVRGSYTLS
jgi:hypothetical protein